MKNHALLSFLSILILSTVSCDKNRNKPGTYNEPYFLHRSFNIYLVDSLTGQNLISDSGRYNPEFVYINFYVEGSLKEVIKPALDNNGFYILAYPYILRESYEPEKTYLNSRYHGRFDIYLTDSIAPDTFIIEKTVDSFVHFYYNGKVDTLIPAFPGIGNETFILKIEK